MPEPTAILAALLGLAVGLGADQSSAPRRWFSADPSPAGLLEHRHLGLVINEADPLSEAIGRTYQSQRRIPEGQVIRVRLPVGQADLSAAAFLQLQRQLRRRTPPHVQAYALAWTTPWRVGCQSITAAITLGRDHSGCRDTCRATRVSRYYARGDVRRPWDGLRLRPSMLLAATDLEEARRLIERGVAADGTAPPGTAYLLSTSDVARNVRAAGYQAVVAAVGPGFQVRVLQGQALRGAKDVMAYFTGLAHVPAITTNRFRPGAVAD
ncbi:MAG: TIGR03790 family protein, partial [Synechococcaceae cyanobacterium]